MIIGLISAILFIVWFNVCGVNWTDPMLPISMKIFGFIISLFVGILVFVIFCTVGEYIKGRILL